MDRLGHSQITTTQRYLHALDTADDTALTAFLTIRNRDRPPHRLPRTGKRPPRQRPERLVDTRTPTEPGHQPVTTPSSSFGSSPTRNISWPGDPSARAACP